MADEQNRRLIEGRMCAERNVAQLMVGPPRSREQVETRLRNVRGSSLLLT